MPYKHNLFVFICCFFCGAVDFVTRVSTWPVHILMSCFFFFPKGEWKPKQIDNPNYKGEWVHPEIDNPEYQPDDQLYKYDDIGALGFDLWQVRLILYWPVVYHLACKLEGDNSHWRMDKSSVRNFVIKLCGKDHGMCFLVLCVAVISDFV